MTGLLGSSEFCFPRISMFPETKILGKQNSLFPSGPVIKCLLFHFSPVVYFLGKLEYHVTNFAKKTKVSS